MSDKTLEYISNHRNVNPILLFRYCLNIMHSKGDGNSLSNIKYTPLPSDKFTGIMFQELRKNSGYGTIYYPVLSKIVIENI